MEKRAPRVGILVAAVVLGSARLSGQETAPATPSAPEAPASPAAVEQPPAASISAAPAVAPVPEMAGGTNYTVQRGDSLWKIGRKFKVPVEAILMANGMKSDRLQIGDVLKIPPQQPKLAPGAPVAAAAPGEAPAAAAPPEVGPGQYMVRQGDTLWDIARAHNVSVQEILKANNMKSNRLQIGQILTMPPSAQAAGQPGAPPAAVVPPPVTPPPTQAPTAPVIQPMPEAAPAPPGATQAPEQPAPPRPAQPGASNRSGASSVGLAFAREADGLAARHIRYAQRWRPPGERTPLLMDCSNTSRYLYRRVAGIDIPRTASDQYYTLHKEGLAWRVPSGVEGAALNNYLARSLRPGDLLFWEHTYKPKRNPPVTHVMVYLGRARDGKFLMAGSSSGGRGLEPSVSGGPDVYFFDPLAPAGGYSRWFGMVRVQGRFVGFGRPLGKTGISTAQAERRARGAG